MAERDHPANEDEIQTGGRKANAAQPLNSAGDNAGAERYPPVRQDDSVETGRESRSFGGDTGNPAPRRGAGDTSAPPSSNDGRLGPGADPAEGKR